MGRAPVSSRVSEEGLNKGPWTEEEDAILTAFIKANGEGNWRTLPKLAGLRRCRKSCRLRWMNYLRPDLKRGNFSPDEDELIAKLHSLLGNRWSLIAGRIPGRTDNEIKNYWNSRLRRKLNATLGEQVQATPISCSHLDSALEQGSIRTSTAPSTSFASETNQAIANPGECSFPEYAEGFAASSSLDVQIFPEYARFQPSSEATPSEPCSSDGSIRTSTAPSTSFASEANQAIANPGECSFPEYAEGFAASSSLDVQIFPEYARFQPSSEATPSEPCSSDGTACLDYCSDHQYYSTWTPVASDVSADSMKHESYAFSPESALSQGIDSEEDFLCSSDFMSFTNGWADLGDTSFQMLLHSMPLSPMHKNLVSVSWPVDALWS